MAGESKNFNYKGEGKVTIKGEVGVIATSTSSVGTFQEHVYPDTVGLEMVN